MQLTARNTKNSQNPVTTTQLQPQFKYTTPEAAKKHLETLVKNQKYNKMFEILGVLLTNVFNDENEESLIPIIVSVLTTLLENNYSTGLKQLFKIENENHVEVLQNLADSIIFKSQSNPHILNNLYIFLKEYPFSSHYTIIVDNILLDIQFNKIDDVQLKNRLNRLHQYCANDSSLKIKIFGHLIFELLCTKNNTFKHNFIADFILEKNQHLSQIFLHIIAETISHIVITEAISYIEIEQPNKPTLDVTIKFRNIDLKLTLFIAKYSQQYLNISELFSGGVATPELQQLIQQLRQQEYHQTAQALDSLLETKTTSSNVQQSVNAQTADTKSSIDISELCKQITQITTQEVTEFTKIVDSSQSLIIFMEQNKLTDAELTLVYTTIGKAYTFIQTNEQEKIILISTAIIASFAAPNFAKYLEGSFSSILYELFTQEVADVKIHSFFIDFFDCIKQDEWDLQNLSVTIFTNAITQLLEQSNNDAVNRLLKYISKEYQSQNPSLFALKDSDQFRQTVINKTIQQLTLTCDTASYDTKIRIFLNYMKSHDPMIAFDNTCFISIKNEYGLSKLKFNQYLVEANLVTLFTKLKPSYENKPKILENLKNLFKQSIFTNFYNYLCTVSIAETLNTSNIATATMRSVKSPPKEVVKSAEESILTPHTNDNPYFPGELPKEYQPISKKLWDHIEKIYKK